jgi:hypothetical protein
MVTCGAVPTTAVMVCVDQELKGGYRKSGNLWHALLSTFCPVLRFYSQHSEEPEEEIACLRLRTICKHPYARDERIRSQISTPMANSVENDEIELSVDSERVTSESIRQGSP